MTLLPGHTNSSNGRIWLSYRAADKSIRLGYRVDNDPTARDYATYDLSANARIQAQSSKSPAICVFQDKLYVAWKPDNADVIKYQRTDGEGNWESNPFSVGGSNVSGLPGPSAPAFGVSGGKLYLAWLAKADSAPYDIWFTTSSDGSQWTAPGRIQVLIGGSYKYASSSYPPCFSKDGSDWIFYWISGSTVYFAPVVIAGSTTAVKTVTAPWSKPTGISCVYRDDQQWILVTDTDQNISVTRFPKAEFSLTGLNSLAKSSEAVGVAILPGTPSASWKIFVVWEGREEDQPLLFLRLSSSNDRNSPNTNAHSNKTTDLFNDLLLHFRILIILLSLKFLFTLCLIPCQRVGLLFFLCHLFGAFFLLLLIVIKQLFRFRGNRPSCCGTGLDYFFNN